MALWRWLVRLFRRTPVDPPLPEVRHAADARATAAANAAAAGMNPRPSGGL